MPKRSQHSGGELPKRTGRYSQRRGGRPPRGHRPLLKRQGVHSMQGPLDHLRDDPSLRIVLEHYHAQKTQFADREWHDRLMALEDSTTAQLSQMHAFLLANGWLETRVTLDAFKTPGLLAGCYRITPPGVRALQWILDGMDIVPEPEEYAAAAW